jgi:peptidoglycan/xylan/chitin deacetylase (PgdA/CDA1 family)
MRPRRTPAFWTALTLCGLAMAAVAAPDAGGSLAVHRPLRVHRASLTQDGPQLVWHVRMDTPFSAAAMKRQRRTLCLVIERAKNRTVAGVLCLQPSHHGRHPRLVYQHVTARGPGPGKAIAATISRSDSRELTTRLNPADIDVSYRPIRWQILTTLRAPACADPHGCKRWFPAKPTLTRLHTPQLVACVPSGPSFVYHGPSSRRVIALTFDDGPWTQTPQFLSVLEREHVQATFFQIGRQIGTYGAAVERRMLADGDMIGDHTWSHADVAGAGSFAAGQISMAAAAIRGATGGFTPCLFRAPGGAVSSALIAQARSMGYTTIQWDIDPRDWARPGTGAIYSNVIANAHPGAIVIQHDGGGDRSETLAALPREIDTLRAEGYRFVTVTELLGQRLIYK